MVVLVAMPSVTLARTMIRGNADWVLEIDSGGGSASATLTGGGAGPWLKTPLLSHELRAMAHAMKMAADIIDETGPDPDDSGQLLLGRRVDLGSGAISGGGPALPG